MKLLRSGDKAMIRDRSGQRRRWLYRIEATHFLRTCRIASGREISSEAQVSGRGAEEIAIDSKDDIGLMEFRRHFEWLAISEHGAL